MELVTTTAPAFYEGGVTKKEIETLALLIVEETLEKGIPIEMAEKIAATEKLIKGIKDNSRYSDYVREELAKNSGKHTTESGTKIEACEVGTKYNFDQCGDVELAMLEQQLMSAENAVKERKEFLKKVPASGLDVVDPNSGEVYKVYPPSKTSTSSYKVTIK